MELGTVGVWTRTLGADDAAAAALVEELGFGAFWLGGSPMLPATHPLLEATERLPVATGIVNVWQNDPVTLAAQYAELDREFPGRLLLGIGAGHPEVTPEYARPRATIGAFLDGLDGAPTPVPRDRRCLAALGGRMLDLSAQRSRGAHSYFVPVEHTREARRRLGDGPLLAVELSCVVDRDRERARQRAAEFASYYLSRSNYTRNLTNFGFAEEDLAGGGSPRLLDAVVPQGSADDIAAVVRAHLAAGADHVCVQPVGVTGIPREEWGALAAALIG